MNIANNVKFIREQIDSINPEVKIIAATKTQTVEAIKQCMGTKLVLSAGENRVQELIAKYDSSFRWDFIGTLQRNKVKYVVDKVELIHSVDKLSLAETINKECKKINKIQNILIEINAGEEESKGGIKLSELDEFLCSIAHLSQINVKGIMAVAPICDDDAILKRIFDNVYEEFFKRKNNNFNILSMGMSNDYLTAVQCGANVVRIGRGIFGERVYNNG